MGNSISVGIKRLLDDLRVTAAQVCVTTAKLNSASTLVSTGRRVSIVSTGSSLEVSTSYVIVKSAYAEVS
ncbi:hypothetical protein Tco_0942241 [Tanacetum coccineum]